MNVHNSQSLGFSDRFGVFGKVVTFLKEIPILNQLFAHKKKILRKLTIIEHVPELLNYGTSWSQFSWKQCPIFEKKTMIVDKWEEKSKKVDVSFWSKIE